MRASLIAVLSLLFFLNVTRIVVSGDEDSDIFVQKLSEVIHKGFPYLCDRRYTNNLLKNMVIPDTIVWKKQEGFSYKCIVVPDIFCNTQEKMGIMLISGQCMPINIHWELLISEMQHCKWCILVIQICETLKDKTQEIVTTCLESIARKDKESIIGIDCSNCGLKEIPEIMYQFTLLRYFRVENNEIQEVPEQFFSSLPHLRWFFASKNQIKKIPLLHHDILENIDLSHNQLSILLCGVLPQLRYLHVEKNPELENSIIIDCLNNTPKLKKFIISDQKRKYDFLEDFDFTKYQIEFNENYIEITS